MNRKLIPIIAAYLLGFVVITGGQIAVSHFTTNSSLPTNCRVGDYIQKTGSSAGPYYCSATNTWTAFGTGGGSSTMDTSPSQLVIVKASDETVTSSTTLQDDNDFQFAIAANEIWVGEITLYYSAATGGDISWDFTAPSGATGTIAGNHLVSTATTNSDFNSVQGHALGSPTGNIAGGAGTSNIDIVRLSLSVVNSSTAGTVKFQWAQGTSSGSATTVRAGSFMSMRRMGGTLNAENYFIDGGRLTTESGVPVSTSDRTGQSTVYWTPFIHNQIGLYSGSTWIMRSCSEVSLSLSGLTADKNYDVFMYDNSGACALELSSAWTNDTTRANAITTQDGIYVKSGTTTRRLIGTIRTTGTTTTEDSAAKRFVASVNNRRHRPLVAALETANSWSYTTASWRQSNANTANQLMYVVSLNDESVHAHAVSMVFSASNIVWATGIGVNSTSTNSATPFGINTFNFLNAAYAEWDGNGSIGYNYLAWLEYGGTGATFQGDLGTPAVTQTGIQGWVVN